MNNIVFCQLNVRNFKKDIPTVVVKDDKLVLDENNTKFKTLEELSESRALRGKK